MLGGPPDAVAVLAAATTDARQTAAATAATIHLTLMFGPLFSESLDNEDRRRIIADRPDAVNT
jgi:hypothetical protein